MSGSRLSSWSGIRRKLEQDYLCPALRGRIQYFAATYRQSHDREGRVAIRLDGAEVLRSDYYAHLGALWPQYDRLMAGRENARQEEIFCRAEACALEQGAFDQRLFYQAFWIFDNQSIRESLASENPLVVLLALLDRRVGKRRLLALGEEMDRRPAWLQAFYGLRLQAEGLAPAPTPGEGPAGQPLPPPGPQIAGPDTERKL